MPRIPLIEDLTTGTIPAGSNIVVEYEPSSQWYAASFTIAAGWLKQGGFVSYTAEAQSPDSIRNALKRLGIDTAKLEAEPAPPNEQLRIWDFYTPSLGFKSSEKLTGSLKASDLSIEFAREQSKFEPEPLRLRVDDDMSTGARFNDEKSWVEFLLTRGFPMGPKLKSTAVGGLMKGVHSVAAYNRLEAASDGIVDIKVEEQEGEIKNLLRIRTMRNLGFDSRWHTLKINENFEVTLEK
jgi:KaiC/GvpD/RAD55 family RecA-like ATPase